MAVEKNKGKNFGIIILAAGESSRLGQPKQLLKYGQLTLLEHCIHVAHGSTANSIIVVVCAHADVVSNRVDDKTHFVTNGHWQEGMASSIRFGIRAALDLDPLVEGAIFMVCDQPYVTSLLLNTLLATYQTTG